MYVNELFSRLQSSSWDVKPSAARHRSSLWQVEKDSEQKKKEAEVGKGALFVPSPARCIVRGAPQIGIGCKSGLRSIKGRLRVGRREEDMGYH